jgi:hypothetical protein
VERDRDLSLRSMQRKHEEELAAMQQHNEAMARRLAFLEAKLEIAEPRDAVSYGLSRSYTIDAPVRPSASASASASATATAPSSYRPVSPTRSPSYRFRDTPGASAYQGATVDPRRRSPSPTYRTTSPSRASYILQSPDLPAWANGSSASAARALANRSGSYAPASPDWFARSGYSLSGSRSVTTLPTASSRPPERRPSPSRPYRPAYDFATRRRDAL